MIRFYLTLSVQCHSHLSNMDFTFIEMPSLGGVEIWLYLLRVPWQHTFTAVKEGISAYEIIQTSVLWLPLYIYTIL